MSETLNPIEPAPPATVPAPVATEPRPERLRDTWPLHRREYAYLGVSYVVLTLVWVGIGELLTGPLDGTAITDWDQRVSEWFVDRRTPTMDTWTKYGSLLADTFVKIGVTAVVVVAMLVILRRFREPVLIAVSLILEASVFITVTVIVARPRPDVPRLEQSPVDSSFPSGHVAAAVAYTAIAIAIFWTVKNVAVRVVTVVVVVTVPVIVAYSRVYRGMHYATDVAAGALLGGAAVWCTWIVLRPGPADEVPAATSA